MQRGKVQKYLTQASAICGVTEIFKQNREAISNLDFKAGFGGKLMAELVVS